MSPTNFLAPLLLIVCLTPSAAQFVDNFADGEFTGNPRWQGTDSRFVISGGRLKLQAPATAGTAYLATPSEAIHDASWMFRLQMDFTPSSSNYAEVYLVADHSDLGAALDGYLVKVGNTTREVSLYRQTGTTETEIIDGLDDRINQAIVSLTIRVTRSTAGRWELYTDMGNTGNWSLEGSATDVAHSVSSWFGIHCTYSSTRSDKFWFDDFIIAGTRIPDLTPPTVVRVVATDPSHFEVKFSEPLAVESVSSGLIDIAGPGRVTNLALSSDLVTLSCVSPAPLINGVSYKIAISAFTDLAGNAMAPTDAALLYFVPGKPRWKSVLISEILPDPTPQVGLPAAEFVELYNAGNEPYDLANWNLTDGNSVGVFPSAIFLPGEYRIVTSTSSLPLFSQGGVIGLTNFPSLNNASDRLLVTDNSGVLLDSLNYSLAWYGDEDKQQGGWSLELIDPMNPCGEMENWTSSESPNGGTPGEANSVLANKPDFTDPEVSSIFPATDQKLLIRFNESLSPSSLTNALISIEPMITIEKIDMVDPSRRTVEAALAEALRPRTTYAIHISGIRDCAGNEMSHATFSFGLPEPADSLDVMLTEILFNPRAGGVDFVELINASDKFIDLTGGRIGNSETQLPLPPVILRPHQRVAITPEPSILRSHYSAPENAELIKSNLPSLPDDEGMIRLMSRESKLLDELAYSRQWHSPLIKDEEGVSLERIDTRAATQWPANWMSASSRVGFATPGLPNSQERNSVSAPEGQVYVLPEIFSPGVQEKDFAQIYYSFEQPGRLANIQVYNIQGQPVKQLGSNEVLGTEGFFRWDGDRDDGSRASAGYYIVWFETFDMSGSIDTYMKRVVIASR